MESRGGVTGGATIADFLAFFATQGYGGTFLVRPGARIECASCGRAEPAQEYPIHRLRRVEGVSDPDDMCIVAALECPACRSRGTFTACVGARCPPEDGDVLRVLDHSARVSRGLGEEDAPQDASLVSDSGWLPGPRSG